MAFNARREPTGACPVRGGAAPVLKLALDPARELRAVTVRTLSSEVVIGLISATLER
jgi:hypothetical protein